MPYLIYLSRIFWFLIQNTLIFHLQYISMYFYGWAFIVKGMRIDNFHLEVKSFGTCQKDRFYDTMVEDECQDDVTYIPEGDDGEPNVQ